MAFFNAIKGTTAGAPGTGAFTPNAAASGYRAWSNVPAGWIGLVRYEDGSAWELSYSYWNGTTLSRASTQLYDSSTGSALSLTSAATAAMIVDAREVMTHLGGPAWRGWLAQVNSTTVSNFGMAAPTVNGTAVANTIANTNFKTEQLRVQVSSATTASALGGWSMGANSAVVNSTSAGRGGYEVVCRFGANQLPTGPRLIIGLSTVTVGSFEPSAITGAHVHAFAKDSTDTNIQFLTQDGTTSRKVDTGIPLNTTGWYEATIWQDAGSNRCYGLLVRLDTGDIWFGSTTTNVPASGSTFLVQALGGLNASNTGTAFQIQLGSYFIRSGV
jgi:hypothetical protein